MIFSIIFIILIILGVGLPIVLLLTSRQHPATTLGISYLLGIGLFTFLMFLTNIAGIRFSLLNEIVLLLIISIPLVLLKRNDIGKFFTGAIQSLKKLKFSPFEKITVGVLVFVVISSFMNTLYWPVYLWDSLVLYDFRAHIFAASGFMKDAFIDSYYTGYPLLTSLAQSIIYLTGGKYAQFIHSLFYLSLGMTFYGLLREFVSRKISLLFTLILLVTEPIFYHSIISYTNLPYSVYLSLGAIYVYLWDKKKQRGYLLVSGLLVGLSTWTRSIEPFWLAILLVVFLVALYRRRFWDVIIYSIFFFPIHEVWKVFQNSIKGTGTSTAGEVFSYAKTLSVSLGAASWTQVFGYLYKYVVVPWGAIFVVFILAIISMFLIKKQKKYFLIFFITFALIGVLFAGTFVYSFTLPGWFSIGDAAERLSILFYPLFIYCIALVVQELGRVSDKYN